MRSAIGKSMLAVVSSCRTSPLTRVLTRMSSNPSSSSTVTLQRVVGRAARRYLRRNGQGAALERLAQSRKLRSEPAAEIDDASAHQGSPARRAPACEGEELHAFVSLAALSRRWTYSWRLFFF